MTDIDFDELDKAVSSAMASANQDNVQQTVKLDTTSSAADARGSRATIVSRQTVANPRTGRFMDFVPSNSDTSVKIDAPEAKVSREADLSRKQDIQAAAPVIDSAQSSSVSTGVDIVNNNSEPETAAQPDQDMPDLELITKELNDSVKNDPENPIESPFLQNAKIDKRPLGTFSEGVPAVSQPNEEVADMMQQAEEASRGQSSADMSNPVANDVAMASGVMNETKEESQTDMQTEVSAPSMESESASMAEAQLTTDGSDLQSGIAGSINPQYQAQPSTGDKTNGAIYDTNDYHKSALQPKRKKSIFVNILWTLLLIIIGAATGAAVYFFVLPNINI